MQTLPFKQVDVFTQRPFWGNPVAVVIGAEGLSSEAMQRIAAWTNLSETTFILRPSNDQADYRLRIFSPKQELPFAGHPTVGSAHAAMESGFAAANNGKLRQECLAGILELTIDETAAGKKIFVQAPKPNITPVSDKLRESLARALGQAALVERPLLRVDVGVVWLIADGGSAAAVASLTPAMDAIADLSATLKTTGITVFGRAEDGISSVHVRSFAPAQGISEDPVCGSGNACVAAYLIHTGGIAESGAAYMARQGMQVGRDGQIAVTVQGDAIKIGGYAVTCVDGNLRLD